jgi:hypothetical protein
MSANTKFKPLPEGEYSGEITSSTHERKRKYNLVVLVKTLKDGKKYLLPVTVSSLNTAYQIAKKIRTDEKLEVSVATTPNAKIEKNKISDGQFIIVPTPVKKQ